MCSFREWLGTWIPSKPSDMLVVCGRNNAHAHPTQLTDIAVRNNFEVVEIDFHPKSIEQQTSLFYQKAFPIKILSIRKPC